MFQYNFDNSIDFDILVCSNLNYWKIYILTIKLMDCKICVKWLISIFDPSHQLLYHRSLFNLLQIAKLQKEQYQIYLITFVKLFLRFRDQIH
jgi:hypothetical protein